MKKLYAGLAAAALTATGIACSAGAARATSPWPSVLGFTPDGAMASVSSVLSTDGTKMYTVAMDAADNSTVDVATTVLATGATTQGGPLVFDDTSFAPDAVAVAGDGTIVLSGIASNADSYALGNVDSVNATVHSASSTGNGIAAISPDGTHAVVGGDENGSTELLPLDLANAQTGNIIDLGAGNGGNANTSAAAVAVGNDGAIDAAVTTWDAATETTALQELAWDGTPTGTTSLDGTPHSLVPLLDGSVAVGIGEDGSYAVQFVGTGARTVPLGDTAEIPLRLNAAPDGTVWATGNSGSVSRIKDSVATTLDGSSTTSAASYGGVFGAVGTNDTLYLLAAPWDAADDADGPAAVYALGMPSEAATAPSTHFEDATTLAVDFTGVLDAPTPIGYTVTVTDHSDPSQTWTRMAWDSGRSDGTDRVTFAGANPTRSYDVNIRAFNGGFLGAPVTTAYTPPTGGGTTPAPPAPPVVQVPTTVGTIKATGIKASSKKLTLVLGGVTSAPGKVKVYDGKKLLGKATISNGRVTLKLKKHLAKGKHTIKLKYAGSPQLAGFTKAVKLKVS